MSYEKFGVPPAQKPDNGEDAFNKLMAEAQLLEDVSFVEEDEGVNVESANRLIERLNSALESDSFTNEDDMEAREMIIHLEKMQGMFSPVPQEINTALAQLRLLRIKLHAETA